LPGPIKHPDPTTGEEPAIPDDTEEMEQKREELRSEIDDLRSEGWVVTRLEKAVEGDPDDAWKVFSTFVADVEKLVLLRKRVDKLDDTHFAEDIFRIEEKLNNPDMIDDIEEDLTSLEKAVASLNSDLEDIRNELDDIRSDGFNVDNVQQQVESDPRNAWDVLTKLMTDIEELSAIRKELQSLPPDGFELEIQSILEDIKDPDNLDEVRSDFKVIKTRILKQAEDARAEEPPEPSSDLDDHSLMDEAAGELDLGDEEDGPEMEEGPETADELEMGGEEDRDVDDTGGIGDDEEGPDDGEKDEAPDVDQESDSEEPEDEAEDEQDIPSVKDQVRELLTTARNHFQDNELQEAWQVYDSIMEMDPDNREAKFFLRKILTKLEEGGSELEPPSKKKTAKPKKASKKKKRAAPDKTPSSEPGKAPGAKPAKPRSLKAKKKPSKMGKPGKPGKQAKPRSRGLVEKPPLRELPEEEEGLPDEIDDVLPDDQEGITEENADYYEEITEDDDRPIEEVLLEDSPPLESDFTPDVSNMKDAPPPEDMVPSDFRAGGGEQSTDTQYLEFLGLKAFENGHLDTAVDHFKKILIVDGRNVTALNNIGFIRQKQGKLKEALYFYDKAVKIHPKFENAWYNRGKMLMGEGEFYGAAESFYNVVKINPENQECVVYLRDCVDFFKESDTKAWITWRTRTKGMF